MNAVGIDVSKGKSMVAIMRPFGEIVSTPFEIKHTASDTYCVHKLSLLKIIAMDKYQFYSLPIQSTVV